MSFLADLSNLITDSGSEPPQSVVLPPCLVRPETAPNYEPPQGVPDTPQFMTQEELDFLHCHEPAFLRKVRHAFVQQRLADYPDHYREWFIDELSDLDQVIVSIGIRHIGITDISIARAVYDRNRVLSCLDYFQQTETDDVKAKLLDMAGVTVYKARKPIPVARLGKPPTAPPASTPENAQEVPSTGPTEPAFTLRSVTVGAGDSAGNTLAKLGYKVQYFRDPETARKALADVLSAGHRLLGLDIETMPKPAYASHLKAGLDPYLAEIRLAQVATPDGKVLVFDHQSIPVNLLDPLMQQPWVEPTTPGLSGDF